ncbi:uncharacterized protein LOC108047794 [Drosophila rhopaloa]|uniref:Uncharacterized protein LOC108047794 n=1 Tax=Drosophila rhopaloa TaxID=1041015 RepID=A0A6P4EZQ8_DRORH|nr:uncharacterized protein LOC108047794 [Drosophila rhopaloa]
MGQGQGSAKSVNNFAIFLLILLAQNCGQARSHGRDGLAKLEFSGLALPVFNFAKIYETLCAQLLPATPPHWEVKGRGLVRGQAMFHVFDQLQQDFEAKWQRTTTLKPFSILQHLDWEQEQQAQRLQAQPNSSFDILSELYKDQEAYEKQTTTIKPFHVVQELEKDLIKAHKHTTSVKPFHVIGTLVEDLMNKDLKEGYLVQKPTEDLAEHKAELKPESRAKQSQKRRRKRIRRRRKRIRRRRKRTRRRRRKKRKKRRKKRKKKRHKGDKKKKKKKKGKRKRKKQPKPEDHEEHSIFQPGQVIFANPTKQPYYHHPYPYPHLPTNQMQVQAIPSALLAALTTKKPSTVTTTTHRPFSKIKYLLRHNSIFKKKKKEYLSHVGQVLYPFVKFVAFFTVLNPFTLGVFLFTLISPAVFGFLGFVALSVLVKPFLHLVFGVKRNVNTFDRKRWLAHKQAEKLKLGLRPVTIHKHFYQQNPVHSAPPVKLRPVGHWRREGERPANQMPPPPLRPPHQPTQRPPQRPPQQPTQRPPNRYNPLLPDHRKALNYDQSGIFLI